MKMKHPLSLAFTFALASTACVKSTENVPESTTTIVPANQEITAVSADGLFEVRVPASAYRGNTMKIVITTHHDVPVTGLAGLVYEIEPHRVTFSGAIEIRARLPGNANGKTFRLADVTEGNIRNISRAVAGELGEWATASMSALDGSYYAVIESQFEPCASRGCGDACDTCGGNPACSTEPGTCDEFGDCTTEGVVCVGDPLAGWTDGIGTGTSFVVKDIGIAEVGGFDLDGRCDGANGCIDNRLSILGSLFNDQIRQGLLGAEAIILFEINGLDDPYNGSSGAITFRHYAGRDADDPFFPANNFDVPEGHTTCCEFLIATESITSDAPPRARWQTPARIERGRLTTLAAFPFAVPLIAPSSTVLLQRAQLAARVDPELRELTEGIIGGVWLASELAYAPNPYCRTVSPHCPVQFGGDSSLLDLVRTGGFDPDIDVDGDGLERLEDTDGDGRIDTCWDGCANGGCSLGGQVPATVPSEPWTCAFDPRMADGYSIALNFTAVRATITGVGPTRLSPSAIGVSFPVEGVVYGNVPALAVSPFFTNLLVRAEPSGAETIAFARDDWNYHFAISGVTIADTLSITPRIGLHDPETQPSIQIAVTARNDCVQSPCGEIPVPPCLELVTASASREGMLAVRPYGRCDTVPRNTLLTALNGSAIAHDAIAGDESFELEIAGQAGDTIRVFALTPDGGQTADVYVVAR